MGKFQDIMSSRFASRLLRSVKKGIEFITQIDQHMLEMLVSVEQSFMFRNCFIIQLSIVNRDLITDLAVMIFDRLFEIVNVDKLNVKLVVEMFYVLELVFGEWLADGLLKLCFCLVEFIAELPEGFSPGVALPGELCNFYLNHGI